MTKYKIPDEDVNQVITGDKTVEMVAESNNVPVSAVQNKKHRTLEKKKFSASFSGDAADKTLPKDPKQLSSSSDGITKINTVPLDCTEALKGFWGLLDGIMQMVSILSQKQIEYEKLSPSEIENLARVSNTSEEMRKLASFNGAGLLFVLGLAFTTFSPKIKVKFKPKHDDDQAKADLCKCDKCVKKREIKKEQQEKMKESFKPIVNEVLEQQKTLEQQAQDFIQRNTGSDSDTLKKADEHIKNMQSINDGRPKIA